MTLSEINKNRLFNQQIADTKLTHPEEIVTWMGAMQAQEYAMAKWAIGLRLPGIKEAEVEESFNRGKILRTHLLRPTWHFVGPADIRWMLHLTGPRVHAANAYMYRKMELDARIFKKSTDIISKSLEGGEHLTREQLQAALRNKKVIADGIRLVCLMMYAELEGVICSGPRVGNKFTYALLDERIAAYKPLSRKEALAELAKRYFTSRGPATLQDFVYWSGLTMKDVKEGFDSVKKKFEEEKTGGSIFIFSPNMKMNIKKYHSSFLMPDYDEFGMGYKNRDAMFSPENVLTEINNRKIILTE